MGEYLYLMMLTTGLAALGGLSFWLKEQLRGRRDALESVRNFGAEFKPASGEADLLIDELAHFPLFRSHGQKHIRNLLTATTDGVETLVFDFFRGAAPTVENSAAHYLVAVFTQWTWAIPDFRIHPATVFDRLNVWMGSARMVFASHPDMTNHYVVGGPDEPAIRAMFRPEAVEFFAAHPSSLWRPYPAVEGSGPRMIIYQHATTWLGNSVPPTLFFYDARRIFTVLCKTFPTNQ